MCCKDSTFVGGLEVSCIVELADFAEELALCVLIIDCFLQEILNGIMERGSQYTELAYIQILQLLNRSRPGSSPGEMNRHLDRLSEILGELAVTV